MRKVLVILFCWLFFVNLGAKEYKVEDVPMVHLQNRYRYTSNPDNILSEQTVHRIDTTLYSLEQRTGIQVVVAALEEIEGGDCFEFAYQLGQKNGVGQKGQNSGLVILLVTSERCIQFATGYGLEGVLPDATCKQIQIIYMNSSFSKGAWDEGMIAGINAIAGILNGTDEFTPVEEDSDSEDLLIWIIIAVILLLTIAAIIAVIVRERMNSKCPMCEHHTMKLMSTCTISRVRGVRTEELTYICTNCGYTKKKKRQCSDTNDIGGGGGAFAGGTIFGTGMGDGSFGGGGGFSGGSFGGGSFGGGGAGSKW